MHLGKMTVLELRDRLYSDLHKVRKEESDILNALAFLETTLDRWTAIEQQRELERQLMLITEDQAVQEPIRGSEREFYIKMGKTYYEQGFFNVPVTSDGAIPEENESCTLLLCNGLKLSARISRNQNRNGTARIFGSAPLKYWFQENFSISDFVPAVIVDGETIMLGDHQAQARRALNGHYLQRHLEVHKVSS